MSPGRWKPESFQRKAVREGWNNTGGRVSLEVPQRFVVPVDEMSSRRTRTYDELTAAQRERFDAQMLAWEAACALASAATDTAVYGIPMHDTKIQAWLDARGAWERTRTR